MRKMKDSGVAWIGEIPSTWTFEKLKNFFTFEKGINAQEYTKEYIGSHQGDFPVYSGQTENDGIMGTIDSFDYDIQKCIFTTTVGAKVMSAKIISGKFSLSQNCLIMKPINTSVVVEYFFYVLIALFEYEKSLIPTYMQPSLRISDLLKYSFFIPKNFMEQKKIASYLDAKCAEIDHSMELVRQGVDKLKEYKKSVITEAVTKGLDPDVPMKASGVPWIELIPQHWDVEPIKYLYDNSNGNAVCVGPFGSTLPSSEICDTGIWVYNQRVILDNNFDTNSICINEKKAKELSGFSVNPGDILITTRGSIGKIAIVPPTAHPGILHPCVIRFRINRKKYNIKLLKYIFNESDISLQQINYMNNSTTIGVLYSYSLKEIKLPAPPLTEQDTIASYLDAKCAEIDTLIAQKQALLDKLAEYKKSLIFECVTGKREVPA